MRRFQLIAVVIAVTLVLSGCTTDRLAKDHGSYDAYESSDGQVTLVPTAKRMPIKPFTATTVDGVEISNQDLVGHVSVLNFWYATCAPCRAEAPILEKASRATAADGVSFLGVNVSDEADTARSFEQTYNVTYPSVLDAGSGVVRVSLAGSMAASMTPTTMILDSKGRIAARVLGRIDSASILESLISAVLKEDRS